MFNMDIQQENNQIYRFFMYCRKSSEDKDRQAASIPSQEKELTEIVNRNDLKVIRIIRESQSAHHKGRPLFNQMIADIEQGKANGILVWDLNRIGRNLTDLTIVVDLMENGYLDVITTRNRTYHNNADDKADIAEDLVHAKEYSDKLSEIVKRGNRRKFFDHKEWSGTPKIGYVTIRDELTGRSRQEPDEERFSLLQKAGKLIINGMHTVGQALYTLNNEWGFKTRPTRKFGRKELSRSAFYRFLKDPFYYGLLERKLDGKAYSQKGNHVPMFTKEEFDLLQIRLGSKGKPHRSDHEFPYKNSLKCGECEGAITAYELWQIMCPRCKKKFAKGKLTESCRHCGKKIIEMVNPKVLHYIYYSCTKKTNPDCTQGNIEIKKLEGMIDNELKKFEIPEEFATWAIKYLHEVTSDTEKTQSDHAKYLQKQLEDCLRQIQNLLNLKTRPDNADGSLLSENEYISKRKELLEQKESLSQQILKIDQEVNKWVTLTEDTFKFACYARYWLAKGDIKTKNFILSKLGYNLTLKDRNLLFDQPKPFFLIQKGKEEVQKLALAFEPNKEIITPTQMLNLEPICISWRRGRDSNSRELIQLRRLATSRNGPAMRPLQESFRL